MGSSDEFNERLSDDVNFDMDDDEFEAHAKKLAQQRYS